MVGLLYVCGASVRFAWEDGEFCGPGEKHITEIEHGSRADSPYSSFA
jgi:hypothetical protein